MIKTQIQAQSHGNYAVGFQHGHKSTFEALRRVFREKGVKGLWRGWTGILVRTSAGSSAQLSTFSKTKEFLVQYEFFADSVFYTACMSSMVSGLFTSIVMTPFDTVATRIFNQGEWKFL